MSRRRVALFMPGSLGPRSSGMYVPALNALVEDLSAHHDIVAFNLIRRDGDQTPFELGNAHVEFIPFRFDAAPGSKFRGFVNSFFRIHRIQRFDAVHGFWAVPAGAAACFVSRLAGIPSIVSLQGGESANLPSIGYGNLRALPLRHITVWTARAATHLVALSEYHIRPLRQEGVTREDVMIIPYGADPEEIPVRRPTSRQSGPVRFLHVGDLNRVKDQGTLLRTFAILATQIPCSLRILGEDTLDGAMHDLARDLGIADRVEFLGHVPHIALAPYYESSDVYLHTSLYESGSVAVAEAAQSGLLIAGTRVGILETLGETAALLVQPGDAEGLAGLIVSAIHDSDKALHYRNAAHHWACEHTRQWTALQYEKLYKSL